MTTTEIEAKARIHANATDDTKFSAAQVLTLTNEAFRKLWRTMVSFRNPIVLKSANISIAVGTSSYTLTTIASDFLDIIDVFDATAYSKLKEIFHTQKYAYQDNYYVYYRYGGKIYFCYTPSETRTLELVYVPVYVELSTGTSTWLPVDYDELISYLVAIDMLGGDERALGAEAHLKYVEAMEDFRDWASACTAAPSFSYEAYGEGYYRRNTI